MSRSTLYSCGRIAALIAVALLLVLAISDMRGTEGPAFVRAGEPEVPLVGPSGVSGGGPAMLAGGGQTTGSTDVEFGGINEPTIAVNPLDSTNIVAASLFRLRVSTDNGATFSAPTVPVVPSGYGLAGDPSLAFDSQGRLFWTYLGRRTTTNNLEVFIVQVNPATGAIMTGPFNVTAGAGYPADVIGNDNDKEWLAADHFPGSPYQDRLYVVWTRFDGGATEVHTAYSADQGATWTLSSTDPLSTVAEGFVWPTHNAVAANGDVYVAYHSQPTFVTAVPDGLSGQIIVLRSTDGGVSYPQKTAAFPGGSADITFNVQFDALPRKLNQNESWTQGSGQPWILPDPMDSSKVYVIAADDPTDTAHGGSNDDMGVFIARSTDSGVTWNAPVQIDSGPGSSHQFFPTAGIDYTSQCIAVTWYDTRNGATNANGNYLLDLFMRTSPDGGLTFGPEVQLNDVAFDPDLGAVDRFPPSGTYRIGEYNGVAVVDGTVHAVWTGNRPTFQQVFYDKSGGSCPVESAATKMDTGVGNLTTGSGDTVEVVLDVPAGALKGSTNITIDVFTSAFVPAPTGEGVFLSRAFVFGPDGLTFNTPATLTISYDDSEVIGFDESTIDVIVYDSGADDWELADVLSRDTVANTLTISMLHFSAVLICQGNDCDLDGCTNTLEEGSDEKFGGQRDMLNPHDFYDVNGDQIIDLSNDILGVILHYAPTGPGSGDYDANYDRGPSAGPNPWNMTAPDGVIDLSIDIFGTIQQYDHDCR